MLKMVNFVLRSLTENIAGKKTSYTNTGGISNNYVGKRITDLEVGVCYISLPQDNLKRVWIILEAEYNIAMIYIATYEGVDSECKQGLTNFKIGVGKFITSFCSSSSDHE